MGALRKSNSRYRRQSPCGSSVDPLDEAEHKTRPANLRYLQGLFSQGCDGRSLQDRWAYILLRKEKYAQNRPFKINQ